MPTTLADLERWREQKDAGKFLQILQYLDGEQNLGMRLYALELLASWKDPGCLRYLLTEYFESDHVEARLEQLIANWGSEVADLLIDLVKNGKFMPRKEKSLAIWLIGKLDEDSMFDRYLELIKEGEWSGPACRAINAANRVDRFVQLLYSPVPPNQIAALQVMKYGKITKFRTAALARALVDEDVQVRTHAYSTLNDYVSDFDLDRLVDVSKEEYDEFVNWHTRQGLEDEEGLVRCISVEIARELKDPWTYPRIIELASQKDERSRWAAMEAMREFPHRGTLGMLMEAYRGEEEYRKRAIATNALVKCEDEGVFEGLQEIYLYAENKQLACLAVDGLLQKDPSRAVKVVLDAILEKPQRCLGMDPMQETGHEVSQHLFRLLDEESDETRTRAVLWLFGLLGRTADVIPLCKHPKALAAFPEDTLYRIRQILKSEEKDVAEGLAILEAQDAEVIGKVKEKILERMGKAWKDPFLKAMGVEEPDSDFQLQLGEALDDILAGL
ncbi:MAG TPA: HEAT repeat domain-containing protein [Anaerolineaceae bacterium]|nr:HEAT repeat domain-containing protein [Anaerolineaceae bacterium]